VHLLLLHETGSNNPLGVKRNVDKISFHPYYSTKDIVGVVVLVGILFVGILLEPYYLRDPENFIPANALVTPIHIQPEWYFLFAYAILRAVPNKLGGVIALVASLLILFFLPFVNIGYVKSSYFSFVKQMIF
jgi:ubiquinol-cytochrome c reductase cytochrome b subunit